MTPRERSRRTKPRKSRRAKASRSRRNTTTRKQIHKTTRGGGDIAEWDFLGNSLSDKVLKIKRMYGDGAYSRQLIARLLAGQPPIGR